LSKNAAAMLDKLDDKQRLELGRAVGFEPPAAEHFLAAADRVLGLDTKSPIRHMLLRCAAHYLGRELRDGAPMDAVARFHLGNGARIERLNWAGDVSTKGIKQSYGLMVNYLYDLKKLDKHRQMLAEGKIPVSSDVEKLI
jgi:malonyl-CoA decarboxylase